MTRTQHDPDTQTVNSPSKISVFLRSHKPQHNARFRHFERVCMSKPAQPSSALNPLALEFDI